MKLKYKKVVPQSTETPEQWQINSTGEIYEKVSDKTYRCIQCSEKSGKLGSRIWFNTDKQEQDFLNICRKLQ